jgi:hypothetical protein
MVTKRKLTEQEFTELIFGSDSDTVILKQTLLLKFDIKTDEITDTNCTEWADDNTHC